MITIIPASGRHLSDSGWLRAYHLFSFGDYSDPKNNGFHALRVFNDDTIAGGNGFPLHPHRDFEIVTIVLEGELTHADSAGNQETLRAGELQRMSAGTGITHSEFNMGARPYRGFQIWLQPNSRGHPASYEKKKAPFRKNFLSVVASPRKRKSAALLKADAEISLLALSAQKTLTLPFQTFFLYVVDGSVQLGEKKLSRGDQARVDGENLRLRGISDSRLVLISFPR